MRGALHHRYQSSTKTGGVERFDAADTRGPDPAWEPVQRTFRVPRWVFRAMQKAAEQAGEPDSAIGRAWLMDAAEQWLTAHNLPIPTP